jgi:hypothetical protein
MKAAPAATAPFDVALLRMPHAHLPGFGPRSFSTLRASMQFVFLNPRGDVRFELPLDEGAELARKIRENERKKT